MASFFQRVDGVIVRDDSNEMMLRVTTGTARMSLLGDGAGRTLFLIIVGRSRRPDHHPSRSATPCAKAGEDEVGRRTRTDQSRSSLST